MSDTCLLFRGWTAVLYYDAFAEVWTDRLGMIASVEAKIAESVTWRYRAHRLLKGLRTRVWEPDTRYLLAHLDFIGSIEA